MAGSQEEKDVTMSPNVMTEEQVLTLYDAATKKALQAEGYGVSYGVIRDIINKIDGVYLNPNDRLTLSQQFDEYTQIIQTLDNLIEKQLEPETRVHQLREKVEQNLRQGFQQNPEALRRAQETFSQLPHSELRQRALALLQKLTEPEHHPKPDSRVPNLGREDI